jgi:hypothetical protein
MTRPTTQARARFARACWCFSTLLLLLAVAGCTRPAPVVAPPKTDALQADDQPRPKQNDSEVAAKAWDTKACLERVLGKAGEQRRRSGTDEQVPLFVFEEVHTSRAGQIEIAVMLLRLYQEYDLRHVALEGYLEGTTVSAKWFHDGKATDSRQRQVAVSLLEQGEISDAEFLALVFPDVKLHPIETKEEHDVKLDVGNRNPVATYLQAIAWQALTDEQRAEVNRLAKQGKADDAVKLLFSKDEWAAKQLEAMKKEGKRADLGQQLQTYKEIEARADKVKATIGKEDRAAMQKVIRFFEARHKASETMVDRTAAVVKLTPKAPAAMIIGAAHSERTCELLEKAKQPYVLVSPKNLHGSAKSNLSLAAFSRKDERLSIDESGALGALLDGHDRARKQKKSEPSIGQAWCQAKAQLMVLCAKVAEAAGGVGEPPPTKDAPFGLTDADLKRPLVYVRKDTIERRGKDVIFQVVVYPEDEKAKKELWMRVGYVGRKRDDGGAIDVSKIESLEQMLLDSRDRVVAGESVAKAVDEKLASEKGSSRPNEKVRQTKDREPPVIRMTADVIGQASQSKGALEAALTSG